MCNDRLTITKERDRTGNKSKTDRAYFIEFYVVPRFPDRRITYELFELLRLISSKKINLTAVTCQIFRGISISMRKRWEIQCRSHCRFVFNLRIKGSAGGLSAAVTLLLTEWEINKRFFFTSLHYTTDQRSEI